MAARMEHWIKQHPLLTFFGLAYAIRWTGEIAAYILAEPQGLALSNEDNLLHFWRLVQLQLTAAEAIPFTLFLLAAGPLFAALIVTAVIEGRASLRDLGRRIVPLYNLLLWAIALVLLHVYGKQNLARGPRPIGGRGPTQYSRHLEGQQPAAS